MMTEKSKKFILIFLGPLFLIFLYLSVKLRVDQEEDILKNGIKVVGTISNVGLKNIDISYTLNGEPFLYVKSKPYSGITSGESFTGFCHKDDPKNFIILFTDPVIDTLKFEFFEIEPTNIKKLWIDPSEISFSYVVNGIKYNRIQKFSDGKRPDDVEGLIIKYRTDRPEISYLVKKS